MKAATNLPWGQEAQQSHFWRNVILTEIQLNIPGSYSMKCFHPCTLKSWRWSLIFLNRWKWASSLSSRLSQITTGSHLRWGILREPGLHLNFKGFHFPVWVWEAAGRAPAHSSIHMLLCKQRLTNPCCLGWHRTRVDTGLMQSQHLWH